MLHAGIILHDAFWTRAVNESNSHQRFDGAVPPFLVYQNRCKNATDLTDGPGFGSVGKALGDKIAKSAGHWERVWQRRPEKVHVPLCAAAAAAAVEAPRSPANDDDARSEASTVVAAPAPATPPPATTTTKATDQVRQVSHSVASSPLLATTPTGEWERALAVAAATDDYPRAYCLPAHLSRLWAACSQLDGGFGCGGPSPLEITQGVRSRRWKAPPEAFFRDAPWLTAHLVA